MENTSEENLAELLSLTKVVDKIGTIRYYNSEGKLHRIHGPAVIYPPGKLYSYGSTFWYNNGMVVSSKKPRSETAPFSDVGIDFISYIENKITIPK